METTQMNQNSNQSAVATTASASAGIDPKMFSALGYFCAIIAVVALCIEPYNKSKFSKFHAVQAILFSASYVILSIVTSILSMVVGLLFGLTGLGSVLGIITTLMSSLFWLVMGLGGIGVWIFLMVSAAQGRSPKLPIIGDMADKFSN